MFFGGGGDVDEFLGIVWCGIETFLDHFAGTMGEGGADVHEGLEVFALPGQVDGLFDAAHVDGDGGVEDLIEAYRGGHMEYY